MSAEIGLDRNLLNNNVNTLSHRRNYHYMCVEEKGKQAEAGVVPSSSLVKLS